MSESDHRYASISLGEGEGEGILIYEPSVDVLSDFKAVGYIAPDGTIHYFRFGSDAESS